MFNIKTLLPVTKTVVKSAVKTVAEHKDTALAVVAVVGLFSSVYMAYKAGPKVEEQLEDAEADKYEREYDKIVETIDFGDEPDVRPARIHELAEERMELTWKEKAPIIFKVLWPTVLSVALTTTCIVLSNRISVKRNAALAAAYALSETNLKDLQDKIVETEGKRKLDKLEDAVTEDQVKRNPPPMDESLIFNTGNGTTLCQDYYTKRYFYSDAEKIRQAITRFNKKIHSWDEASQNEWYDEIDLEHIPYGYNMVLDEEMLEKKTTDGILEDNFTSVLLDESVPVLVVRLNVDFRPKYGQFSF